MTHHQRARAICLGATNEGRKVYYDQDHNTPLVYQTGLMVQRWAWLPFLPLIREFYGATRTVPGETFRENRAFEEINA
jgi:hypothetical protein